MNKRIKAIAAACIIAFGVTACSGGGIYKDGNYSGTGRGAASDIKVSVEVKKGKIDSIKIVEQKETKELINAVESNLIPEIIKKQKTEGVDVITSASSSSKGVLEAVNNALKDAKK